MLRRLSGRPTAELSRSSTSGAAKAPTFGSSLVRAFDAYGIDAAASGVERARALLAQENLTAHLATLSQGSVPGSLRRRPM